MTTVYHRTARDAELVEIDNARKGAWVHLAQPTTEELDVLADTHQLDVDILRDVLDLYEAPRIEKDGTVVYIFTRYCYPEGKYIATEPLLIVYTPDMLVTISRRDSDIFKNIINNKIPIITTQRTKAVLQMLRSVNSSYQSYMKQVSRSILELRSQLSKTDIKNEDFIEFIDLEENLNEFLSALQPQSAMLRSLVNGKFMTLYEDDRDLIEDLALETAELVELTQSRLKTISNTREAYATIMANSLNKTFKRLTSISIFLMIPAITAALYGMNLSLPLQNSPNAFWQILAGVMVVTALVVVYFQKKRWL